MEITNFRSQLLIASEQVTVHVRQAQNVIAKARESVVNESRGLREAVRATRNDLRNWLKSILGAVVVFGTTITKLRSELYVALQPVMAHLRAAQNALGKLKTNVADKPRRLQEAIRARESDLPRLLESSPDAIAVVNTGLRFVAANPKALDLFGISEKNMEMFAMDPFLPRRQILPARDDRSAPFITRKEWHGECRIRRLDGSLRIAEFIFFANYVPFLHVCMFRNDRKWQRVKKFAA
jgi:PAS domain S-box-containing protein